MPNELLLILNVVIVFGLTILWFFIFGKKGLIAFTCIIMILANIEVTILINAYGIEQTLGNIMFAGSFLITDIASELYGKKEANKIVNIGILSSITFIVVTQFWLLYTPSPSDGVFSSIAIIFSNTPRIIFASMIVNAVVQKLDVWLYHKWWAYTEKRTNSKTSFLWVRNNFSTLISQLANAFLFTFAAFLGTYSFEVLVEIAISSYAIYFVTSLLDTPLLYLARKINNKKLDNRKII